MLSTLRRPIVNIFFVLKHSMLFLGRIQLKFVNSEKFYSNFTEKSKRINGAFYIVYEITLENFENHKSKHSFSTLNVTEKRWRYVLEVVMLLSNIVFS